MRTINRFDTQSFNRCYRNAKIIYDISKYGAKGLSKVNPVLVFIDTAISLGELYDSYIKYNQVKERNKQLESELDTLKHEFSNLLKELNLDKEKLKYQLETEFTLFEKRLENNRIEYEPLKKAYILAFNYFKSMKFEIEAYRKDFTYAKETKEIEKKYYETIEAYSKVSLEYIGG